MQQQMIYVPQWYHFIVGPKVKKKVGSLITAATKYELGRKFPPLVIQGNEILPAVGSIFDINLDLPIIVTCKLVKVEEKIVTIEVIDIEFFFKQSLKPLELVDSNKPIQNPFVPMGFAPMSSPAPRFDFINSPFANAPQPSPPKEAPYRKTPVPDIPTRMGSESKSSQERKGDK